jgi:hypothetical protein
MSLKGCHTVCRCSAIYTDGTTEADSACCEQLKLVEPNSSSSAGVHSTVCSMNTENAAELAITKTGVTFGIDLSTAG